MNYKWQHKDFIGNEYYDMFRLRGKYKKQLAELETLKSNTHVIDDTWQHYKNIELVGVDTLEEVGDKVKLTYKEHTIYISKHNFKAFGKHAFPMLDVSDQESGFTKLVARKPVAMMDGQGRLMGVIMPLINC